MSVNVHINGIGMTSQRTRNRLIERLRDKGIHNEKVLEVLRTIPRHLFVDEALASRAYEDSALPIGYGQTISQPYIVARMTQALLEGHTIKNVLEIGTGCGYQTAVLSKLVGKVYTVERIQSLSFQAKRRLHSLKYNNVKFKHTDGRWGWPSYAAYDAIIVTAAPEAIPEELLHQLNHQGRLVVPVGPAGIQQLILITRENDQFHQQQLDTVSFVPLLQGEE